jgi:hypothetical protein
MSNRDKCDTRTQAENLARLGYVIFPIKPNEKHQPLVAWRDNSTCNLKVVRDWWEAFPSDNIGINCEASGLLVVDLDSRDALARFNELWCRHEDHDVSQCGAPIIKTPSGGWHLYFNLPPGGHIRNRQGGGIDIRANGGMVLGPGSVIEGRTYELIDGDLELVPALPYWLAMMLTPARLAPRYYYEHVPDWYAKAQLGTWTKKIIAAPEGSQNKVINDAAFVLALEGADPDLIRSELLAATELGHHPRHRAAPTIESGIAAGRRERAK